MNKIHIEDRKGLFGKRRIFKVAGTPDFILAELAFLYIKIYERIAKDFGLEHADELFSKTIDKTIAEKKEEIAIKHKWKNIKEGE